MRVDELTGATIGRYRLGGRLQVLPYASIHRGTVQADGRQVLVWTFREPYATAAGFLEALQHLAGDRRAAKVQGLLQVLEIGVQELRAPLVYLVTENAESGFLVSLLQSGKAPRVFATTGPLARTIDRMHLLGLVHGDIQPATVAVASQGPVLAGHSIRTVVSRVTPAAAWVDITRSFRPPEAPSSADASRASDLWGLAALVYYLLVGRPPATNGPPEPPSRFRTQLPGRVDEAVIRALSADPAQRFASGLEFFSALRGTPASAGFRPSVSPAPDAGQWAQSAPITSPRFPSAGAGSEAAAGRATDSTPRSAAQVSSRWPIEPPLTPASIRAESLPYRPDGVGSEPQALGESTQLIPLEPSGVEPRLRRRGGLLLLAVLAIAVVVAVVVMITQRLHL